MAERVLAQSALPTGVEVAEHSPMATLIPARQLWRNLSARCRFAAPAASVLYRILCRERCCVARFLGQIDKANAQLDSPPLPMRGGLIRTFGSDLYTLCGTRR